MFKQVLSKATWVVAGEPTVEKSGLNAIIKTLRIKIYVSCSTLAQSESELPELPWFVVPLTTSE